MELGIYDARLDLHVYVSAENGFADVVFAQVFSTGHWSGGRAFEMKAEPTLCER